MSVEVSIAGFASAWSFRGQESSARWFQSQPWSHGGGIRIVRTCGNGFVELLFDWFSRLAASERVEVIRLNLSNGCAVREAIQQEFGLTAERGANSLSVLGTQLRDPVVLLAEQAGPTGLRDPVHEAQGLVEALSKLQDPASLTIVFVDTPQAPLAGEADDWSVGLPQHDLVSQIRGDDRRLWRGYLHSRVAWETGGQLDRAIRWDAELGEVQLGRDDLFEEWLNQRAAGDFGSLSPGARAHLEDWIRLTARRGAMSQSLERSCLIDGTLWQPLGQSRVRPVPWAARGRLCSSDPLEEMESRRHLLPSSLVCAPLARGILSRCFDLEALARSGIPDAAGAVGKVEEELERFRTGHRASARCYYPDGHPHLPVDDPIAFLSVGQVAQFHPSQVVFDLARLRNSLAHGHYVCWRSLMDLRRVEVALS